MAKEIIRHLELAGDRRQLSTCEIALRRRLKLKSLGLSSLQRSIARQESRLLWLSEGDALTRFFHLHASARGRKKFIRSLTNDDGSIVVSEEAKAKVAFQYFDDLLGTPPACTSLLHFDRISIPTAALQGLGDRFMEEEVWCTISELHPEKAPGSDGFTAKFLQVAWPIIRPDLMAAFDAFWRLDSRSFHSINDALLVLLPKHSEAATIRDYRPISLIHCVGKLFSKVLAKRLSP